MTRSFRRSLLCAAVVSTVVAIEVFGAVGHAGADASNAPPSSFVPGVGNALSQALVIAPTTGGLAYAIALATSIADFQDTEGQGESETLTLGSIGTSLESTQCDGSAATLPKSDVPQPVQAESSGGNSSLKTELPGSIASFPVSVSQKVAGLSGGTGAGEESATASGQPSGSATTSIASLDVANFIDVSGMSSTAQAQIVSGQTREAIASSQIGDISLDGGLVEIKGLDWNATNRTGAVNSMSGAFTLSSLTLAGKSMPVGSLDALESSVAIVNTALSPIGLEIELPMQWEPGDGSVHETALTIGVDNSALGHELVGPLITNSETVTQALRNAVIGVDCKYGTELEVGDIGLGVLSGGGNLNLEFGGAVSSTNGTSYADPFGNFGYAPLSNDNSTLFTPTTSSLGTVETAPITTEVAPTTAAAPTKLKETFGPLHKSAVCQNIDGGHCYSSHALPVGIIGVSGIAGFGLADFIRMRRRRRLSHAEV